MKKPTFLFVFILLNSYLLLGQPTIQWEKCYGGTDDDIAQSIRQTNDGGYIIAGYTYSNDSDVTVNHGTIDIWIVKLNNAGIIQWQKSFGGSALDYAFSIQQTFDNGYVIAGATRSNDFDVLGNHGETDYWILKIDSSGTIQWKKTLGGTNDEWAHSIFQTNDGGYIIAGFSESNDGDVTGHHATHTTTDYWIVKLNATGSIQWEKSLGGSGNDEAHSIEQCIDGGYIVAGFSESIDGDVTGNHGFWDFWIVKLNPSGIIQWEKSLGGTDTEWPFSIQQSTDGGFIAAGFSESNDDDVSGNHISLDCWIVKLDSTGNIQFQKSLGGSIIERAYSVQQTMDGGYIYIGYTYSNDGDVTGNHGGADYWAVKLDSAGNIEWQKSLGGSNNEEAYSIQQTNDGGFIAAGFTNSNDGDVTGLHGINNSDVWIVKLDSSLNVDINKIHSSNFDLKVIPNPISISASISFPAVNDNNFKIEILDVEGRLIKYLTKNYNNGNTVVDWDASNNSGERVNNGIYFISIVSDNFCETKKVVVIRD